MQAIGGYFKLADYEKGKWSPHQNGILLITGRNALGSRQTVDDFYNSIYQ